MIATLVIWAYAGVLFYLYGGSMLRLLGRWLNRSEGEAVSLPLTVVFGMSLVTALATILSLVMPLASTAAAILLAGGIVLALISKLRVAVSLRLPRGREWWLVVLMLLAIVFCLESGTRAPSNPDTNVYHAQTIHWIEDYRAVPGLGNLNGRLAYNSSWLLLNAAFSLSFLGLRSFHVLAGLLFLVAVLEFVGGVRALMQRDFSIANWMRLLFIPAAFWVLKGELSSPGTDLPTILLTWMLISSAVEYEAGGRDGLMQTVVLATIPASMLVLKLSAAPLLLVGIYLLARSWIRRQPRLALAVVILMALMLVPWMMRSVILSGYPVFPYPQLDLFRVDWKMPAADVEAVRNGVLGWARMPYKNWGEAVTLPARIWIPEWFGQRTPNQLLTLILAAVAPIGLLPRANRKCALPILATYVALLIWFLGAPNWRFGYGAVLSLAAFAIASALMAAAARLPDRWNSGVAAALPLVLCAFLAFTLAASLDGSSLKERVIIPLDYNPSGATRCRQYGLRVYCASANTSCSYSAFPCVPGMPKSVRARGTSLQDGFYSVELAQEGP